MSTKQTQKTLKEFRVIASKVCNYIAYVEAEDSAAAEKLALQNSTDWTLLDNNDSDYQVYTVEETD